MPVRVDDVVMRAAGISIFGTFGFAICHVVILMMADLGADPEYVWLNAAFFGALGAAGVGKIHARGITQSFWEHTGLCTGAFVAALVSSTSFTTAGVMALVLLGVAGSSREFERHRLKGND